MFATNTVQVSPQFIDELTENGTHLKNHNPRRRKTNRTKQPLQEIKELFPNESDADSLQCPKSSARRNPLNFKQNNDQCLEPSTVGRSNRLRSNRAGWGSQEISMYPSTSVPHSKLRNYEDESSDNSLTDGENDQHLQNVRCNDGLDDRGCPSLSANQYLQLDAVAHLDGANDHTVPSASQQDRMNDDNFEEIRLKLSTATQYTETTHRQGEDTCEQSELIPNQNSHSDSHTVGSHVPQSICQQDEHSIYPKALAVAATVAEDTCNNGGQVSYPSVENLSELIKDMSVGDDIAGNDHSLPVDDQNSSNCEHNVHLKHSECIDRPNCTSTSASASHDHKLNKLEVTIFSPHLASTPFKDQHVQSVNHTFNFVCHEVLTTAQVGVTPGHLEEQDMSILVRETPEHLWCSPHLPNVENHRAECDSKQSFRVSESSFQPAGLKPSYDSNQVEPRCQHTMSSCRLSDIDMTRFNNFGNTDTSHTTLGDTHSSCTTEDMLGCLHSSIPPTQDESTHGSVEWSILAKQTPDELWTSPVIRVVNDSLNCPCLD